MGIVLVTFFFTILYWIRALDYHIAIVEAVVPYPAIDYLMAISVISGTTLLTIGMLWIGRLFVKKRKNLFSVFAAILTPTLIFALFISMVVFVSGDFFAPERLAITKVRVDNTNPLTLSLNMKSFYIYDIYFGYASIKDKNEIPLVPAVEIISDWIVGDYDAWGEPVWTIDWLGKLPGAQKKQ
jgi:hypothetical protein